MLRNIHLFWQLSQVICFSLGTLLPVVPRWETGGVFFCLGVSNFRQGLFAIFVEIFGESEK
jgi:hypothetical protein